MKVIKIKLKIISTKEYLNKIASYLKDIMNNLQTSDTWKIQLTVAINFIFSKDIDEERIIYLKAGDIES